MNPEKIREDFPVLKTRVKGKPIVYFDNSCVTLKPRQVIEAMNAYYNDFTACHGRSAHHLAKQTSEHYEKAREKVAKFIGAKPQECIFTKNTTEGINIVANSLGLKKGDKVITTSYEHNSNILPWKKLEEERGITYEQVEPAAEGEFHMQDFRRKADGKMGLASLTHTSNVSGRSLEASEIREIAKTCHERDAFLMLDGAQSVPHREINVKKLDVDFLVFSGHKMLGPSGTGVLYGRYELLEKMNPFIIGGGNILDYTNGPNPRPIFEKPPDKFEGGLQNYAGAIGLGAAVDYLTKVGMRDIEGYEAGLAKQLYEGLASMKNVEVYGPRDPAKRSALASFTVKGMSPHDVAALLDEEANVYVRSGMHCAHLYHRIIGAKEGTARASLYIYNTKEELGLFLETLGDILKHFA
jgi:cysteine desulfurase/selenocysteine lyase